MVSVCFLPFSVITVGNTCKYHLGKESGFLRWQTMQLTKIRVAAVYCGVGKKVRQKMCLNFKMYQKMLNLIFSFLKSSKVERA